MTDNEIKKALECCADEMGCAKGCPFFDKKKSKCKVASPYGAFEKLLLDLINRQQAEIERLQNKVEELADVLSNSIRIRYAEAKSEAIKEFAEKLKEAPIKCSYPLLGLSTKDEITDYFNDIMMQFKDAIDNLVKEMVGDAE